MFQTPDVATINTTKSKLTQAQRYNLSMSCIFHEKDQTIHPTEQNHIFLDQTKEKKPKM